MKSKQAQANRCARAVARTLKRDWNFTMWSVGSLASHFEPCISCALRRRKPKSKSRKGRRSQ